MRTVPTNATPMARKDAHWSRPMKRRPAEACPATTHNKGQILDEHTKKTRSCIIDVHDVQRFHAY